MGSADAGGNAVPAHEVMLTQDFEIGKYEVTQAQWMSVMGSNSSHFTGLLRPVEQGESERARHRLLVPPGSQLDCEHGSPCLSGSPLVCLGVLRDYYR